MPPPMSPTEPTRTHDSSGEGSDATWTTRALLAWMTRRFTDLEVGAPRVVAEMLLAHVLDCERLRLYMEADRLASPGERTTLRELVLRACRHEPVQYIVGRAPFFSFDLEVSDTTLIPQPATEDLVTVVIDWVRGAAEGPDRPARVADIGTGTGCIAIALARALPDVGIVATDVVAAALDLARRNAERHGVLDRIELREGPDLEPLHGPTPLGRFDVICGNPPYIPDHEWEGGLVERSVMEHVPQTATRGGTDGLDVIRPIIAGAGALLRPGGLLAIEIADGLRDAVIDLAHAAGNLEDVRVEKDHERFWRILRATRVAE